MNFGIDPETLRNGLLLYIVLIGSLCIHEWAHAITAHKLGDNTPESEGRVTLNPIAHMDLMGSVILPLMFIFVFPVGMLFGWGKPVRINPSNFANRKRDEILTTLAGPGSNIALAFLAAIVGGLLYRVEPRTTELFGLIIRINVLLAVFNMIPLPPLDGGQIMRHVTKMSDETFYNISRWTFLIIIVAINIPAFRMILGAVMGVVGWPMMMIYSAIAG